MRYEWDERKNRRNKRKHRGISFQAAIQALEDELCLIRPDRVDEDGEQRWHALGMAEIGPRDRTVLLVVHVYRESYDGNEIIRILSARRAENDDVRRYQEQEMD